MVDLNLPPAQRWAEVIAHHADVLPRVEGRDRDYCCRVHVFSVEGYLQGMMLQIEKEVSVLWLWARLTIMKQAIGNSWIRKMFLSAYKFVKGTFK